MGANEEYPLFQVAGLLLLVLLMALLLVVIYSPLLPFLLVLGLIGLWKRRSWDKWATRFWGWFLWIGGPGTPFQFDLRQMTLLVALCGVTAKWLHMIFRVAKDTSYYGASPEARLLICFWCAGVAWTALLIAQRRFRAAALMFLVLALFPLLIFYFVKVAYNYWFIF